MTVDSLLGDSDMASLRQFLVQNYRLSPPTDIPANLLIVNVTYTFSLTVTNFLLGSASGSKYVTIVDSIIPSVTILGPDTVSLTRNNPLSLDGTGFIRTCNGTYKTKGLNVTWDIQEGGHSLGLKSIGDNPFAFKLNPYTLTTEYSVILTMTSVETRKASSATVKVVILPGALQARISGGKVQTVKYEGTAIIDASLSLDEDLNGVTGVDADLQFDWQCIQQTPLADTCQSFEVQESSFVPSGKYGDKLYLKASPGIVDSASLIMVTITDVNGARSNSVSIELIVISDLSPEIYFFGSSGTIYLNPGQLPKLESMVIIPPLGETNCTWMASDPSFDLQLNAMTAIDKRMPIPADPTVPVSVFLSLRSGAISAESSLSFTLSCTTVYHDGGSGISEGQRRMQSSTIEAQSYSSLVVQVNAPPSGTAAVFRMSPTNGTGFSTVFNWLANNFQDEDLPLTYQFGYNLEDVSGSSSRGDTILRSVRPASIQIKYSNSYHIHLPLFHLMLFL